MPARRPHRLADRLAGVEVVAEIDGIEPCVARAMGGEPASRRHALAVLLVVPILRHDELGLQRHHPAVARRHQRRGHQRMEIFGRAAAALARRAARTMQLYRAVIFRAVERDQHVIAQPAEGREPAASLQHFEPAGKQRMEALRFHRVQHIPNMVVARNPLHPKQRLAVRATMPVPVRQMPLMGQERRALREEHRKRRHADIGHEVLNVFPAPLVRQTRTGLPKCRYEVFGRSHTALESDSSPPANCQNAPRFNLSHLLNVAPSVKMRIAVKVREYPDGSLAVFHGPRRIARYTAQGAQIAEAPTTTSVTPCSPPSRTLRAASGGGLRPSLTAAVRGVTPPRQVGTKKRPSGQTKKLTRNGSTAAVTT